MARASRTSDDVISEQAAAITAAVAAGAAAVQTGRPAAEPLAEWEIALQQEEAAAAAAQAGAAQRAPAEQAAQSTDAAPVAQGADAAPGHDTSDTIDVGADPAEAADAAGVAVDELTQADTGQPEDASTIHGMGASRTADQTADESQTP